MVLNDSTIAPASEPAIFFLHGRVTAARHTRKDTFIEKKVHTSKYFPVCKGLSIDDVGVSRDTAFQEIRTTGSRF